MNHAVFEAIELTAARDRAAALLGYSDLLALADAGEVPPDRVAGELTVLMAALGLTTDDVRRHAAAVARVRELADLDYDADRLRQAAADARTAMGAQLLSIKQRYKHLQEEDRQARRAAAAANDRANRAAEARADREKLQRAYAFLFDAEVRLDLRLGSLATLPRVDGRMLAVDPRGAYAAAELAERFGLDAGPGGPGTWPLPRVGGFYFGRGVAAFALLVRREARRRRREELEGKRLAVDPRLAALDVGGVFSLSDLAAAGFPADAYRAGRVHIGMTIGGDRFSGSQVVGWAAGEVGRQERIVAALAAVEAEELADVAAVNAAEDESARSPIWAAAELAAWEPPAEPVASPARS